VERTKATIERMIASYEPLLETLKEEMKNEYLDQNMCADLDVIIKIRTLVEENAVLIVNNAEIVGCEERIALLVEKYDTLVAAWDPHKDRMKDIGK
ncbi:hypothetical protein KI387_003406, partial [Taxus chinensis]